MKWFSECNWFRGVIYVHIIHVNLHSIYIYVCVYVYMYACMHACMYIRIYILMWLLPSEKAASHDPVHILP